MSRKIVSRRMVGAGAVGAAVVLGVAGLVVAVAGTGPGTVSAAGAAAPPATCRSGAPRLTVQGTGVATGTPNLLTLTLAVNVTGGSASSALSEDNADTTAVVAALATGGVKGKDVQTTGLSIQPQYGKTGTLTGYAVSNSVVAQLHDFGTAGSVIDAAAGAAGDAVRIDSLDFSIQDPRGVQDQARQDAVRQAVSHAATMAAAAGEKLAGVCKLTDDTSLSPGTSFALGTASAAAGTPADRVPLEPGSQQATAQVTVVYALAPRR